ncbi:hypothetical protein QNI22_23265 [Cytophagaceae bacterium BD1B2-1]|uniref:Uncharacterized protein n=1 Tax=Xanthocytophaga agilis TaxID=3048010 RepID=A0AAE3R489_9BACT|nr:hypothetical protein [Xanthocytophaga agilis]MDJ1503606.1 hypothetical protein [Xanthocytophaga agilis]
MRFFATGLLGWLVLIDRTFYRNFSDINDNFLDAFKGLAKGFLILENKIFQRCILIQRRFDQGQQQANVFRSRGLGKPKVECQVFRSRISFHVMQNEEQRFAFIDQLRLKMSYVGGWQSLERTIFQRLPTDLQIIVCSKLLPLCIVNLCVGYDKC